MQEELFGDLVYDVDMGMFNTCFCVYMDTIQTHPKLISKTQRFGGTKYPLKTLLEMGTDKIIKGSKVVGRVYAWRQEDDGTVSDIKCSSGFYVSPSLIATSRHILDSFPSLNYPNKFSFLSADFCPFSDQAVFIGSPIQPIKEADGTFSDLDFKCFTVAATSRTWFLPSNKVITADTPVNDHICYSLQYNGDIKATEIKSHYESSAMKDKVPATHLDASIGPTLSPNTQSVGIGSCEMRSEFGLLVAISLNYGASGGPVCLLNDDPLKFIAVVLGRSETTNSNRAEPVVYNPLFKEYYNKYILPTLSDQKS